MTVERSVPASVGATSVATLCVAIGLPALLAYNLPPSPTALNQALAIGGWGVVVAFAGLRSEHELHTGEVRGSALVLCALSLLAASALASTVAGNLPGGLAASAAGLLAAGALALLAGSYARRGEALWAGLFAALLAAGVIGTLIGILQVFTPDAIQGPWLARSGVPGRAVGNLRQPNHLSTLLLWSAVAAVPLSEAALRRALLAARVFLAALFALLVFGVVLTGSRTGLVGIGVLALWGLVDGRLSRGSRALLLAAPLLAWASWAALDWWAATHGMGALGAATRVGEGDLSTSRFAIWRDTLALIAQHPWWGVGFGEFNIAWSLTPFPNRPTQFFDHTHNLPLQLVVELGLPLGLLVLALLAWGLWQAFSRSRIDAGPHGTARRAAFVMVLLIALHSQLEYPLWYAYFLLPTAFIWGLCLGPSDAGTASRDEGSARPSKWLLAGGVAMVLAAVLTLWDYRRVASIFAPATDDDSTLVERIVDGRHSWFFAHHADYALVTTIEGAGTLPGVFDRATHFLLDTRLMIAWAKAYAAQSDLDRARHVAARLREFRNPGSKEFFAPCDDASVVDKPFQCEPPGRELGWRDFLPAR